MQQKQKNNAPAGQQTRHTEIGAPSLKGLNQHNQRGASQFSESIQTSLVEKTAVSLGAVDFLIEVRSNETSVAEIDRERHPS